jgi:hypothetical protein
MSISVARAEALAVDVRCTDNALNVILSDGRTVSAPLAWFPRLLDATPRQRAKWELISGGVGIHWEAVDEDISVASLLKPGNFMRAAEARVLPPRTRPFARRTRRGSRS